MLEKVAAAEAVHAIRSWTALKQRLGRNRRVWVLTHAALPSEPLAMLEVALLTQTPSSVDELLREDTWRRRNDSWEDVNREDVPLFGSRSVAAAERDSEDDSDEARVAVFYSISATQPGLAGVDVGFQLIRRAAAAMAAKHIRAPSSFKRERLVVRARADHLSVAERERDTRALSPEIPS